MKTVTEKQAPIGVKTTVAPVLVGILGAILVSLLLLILFSFILSAKDMPSWVIGAFACVSVAGGAFAGGYVTARLFKAKGFLLGAVTGAGFFLILYLTGLFMQQVDLNAMLGVRLLLSLLFGMAGGVLGVNSRRKK